MVDSGECAKNLQGSNKHSTTKIITNPTIKPKTQLFFSICTQLLFAFIICTLHQIYIEEQICKRVEKGI